MAVGVLIAAQLYWPALDFRRARPARLFPEVPSRCVQAP